MTKVLLKRTITSEHQFFYRTSILRCVVAWNKTKTHLVVVESYSHTCVQGTADLYISLQRRDELDAQLRQKGGRYTKKQRQLPKTISQKFSGFWKKKTVRGGMWSDGDSIVEGSVPPRFATKQTQFPRDEGGWSSTQLVLIQGSMFALRNLPHSQISAFEVACAVKACPPFNVTKTRFLVPKLDHTRTQHVSWLCTAARPRLLRSAGRTCSPPPATPRATCTTWTRSSSGTPSSATPAA